MQDHIPENHFLNLPRPDVFASLPAGVVDTTTLAAHDFDVDTRTGFMPPQVPVMRLDVHYDPWEDVLDDAITKHLQLGEQMELDEAENLKSEKWRERVRNLPILAIDDLKKSEVVLRRAHLVLAWILHFYVHSLPPSEPVRIPAPLTLPLLQVSAHLQLPPVLTYSDDVLYNWNLGNTKSAQPNQLPTESTIKCHTTFTSTKDEAEFYLTSARMELAGVEALDLMRATMDEAFVGDDIAIRRITEYLVQLKNVIQNLCTMLLSVKKGCKPEVFYNDIRPWFRGEDSQSGREWTFEGLEQDPTLVRPTELSGPSAGQSALVHAIDIFLGVHEYSHGKELTGHSDTDDEKAQERRASFLKRMQLYMPRHHRNFLNHLESNPRPLRDLVVTASMSSSTTATSSPDAKALLDAYNSAVVALKEFRDAHMIIVALYIVGPARRRGAGTPVPEKSEGANAPLKGTGGSNLIQFLKGVRERTHAAILPDTEYTSERP